MAQFLITGVAGFIGSALAHTLLEKGENVRGIDNFSTGKRENLRDMSNDLELIEGDLLDGESATRACRQVDYVLHEAAIPSVPRSVADPLATNRANVEATLNLLVAARDAGVKRVVYAGSSSAYGDTPTLPKHEGMPPSPISPYAVSKLTGEWYMQVFQRVYGLQTVVLRYFNVFGPRQDAYSQYSAVLARFISAMLQGEKPVVYGDGEQSRDFTYIDNVVAANLLACSAPADRASGRVFNIATGDQTTLNQVIRSLKRITGYDGPVVHAPARAGDIRHSLADISRARDDLGYRLGVGFEEGLERTVGWYRKQLNEPVAKRG